MSPKTTDVCDAHEGHLAIVEPLFRSFGARAAFAGTIATVKVFEDSVLVRNALAEPGDGRVLVIDGGGSLRCALVGGQLARLAQDNGWSGMVVYGCVRDVAAIDACDLGVRALTVHPRRSVKKGTGERDIPVAFGGVKFTPGHWLAADEDGMVVAAAPLTA